MTIWPKIASHVARTIDKPFEVKRVRAVGGGSINKTVVLEGPTNRYFVKHNVSGYVDMFEAEAAGLQTLRAAEALRVPSVICTGIVEERAFLVLEYIDLRPPTPTEEEMLGRRLARLHRTYQPAFGWHRDNTIGSTPQCNGYRNSWTEFFRDQRLRPQLALAERKGYDDVLTKGRRLIDCLDDFFDGYDCRPSLLHGDLWAGNMAAASNGEPVVFDPAVYYGDRETDIAMTQLFGGFSTAFYSAYNVEWPLAPGHERRCLLYNLYHLLNHLNLFGHPYFAQTSETLDRLLGD